MQQRPEEDGEHGRLQSNEVTMATLRAVYSLQQHIHHQQQSCLESAPADAHGQLPPQTAPKDMNRSASRACSRAVTRLLDAGTLDMEKAAAFVHSLRFLVEASGASYTGSELAGTLTSGAMRELTECFKRRPIIEKGPGSASWAADLMSMPQAHSVRFVISQPESTIQNQLKCNSLMTDAFITTEELEMNSLLTQHFTPLCLTRLVEPEGVTALFTTLIEAQFSTQDGSEPQASVKVRDRHGRVRSCLCRARVHWMRTCAVVVVGFFPKDASREKPSLTPSIIHIREDGGCSEPFPPTFMRRVTDETGEEADKWRRTDQSQQYEEQQAYNDYVPSYQRLQTRAVTKRQQKSQQKQSSLSSAPEATKKQKLSPCTEPSITSTAFRFASSVGAKKVELIGWPGNHHDGCCKDRMADGRNTIPTSGGSTPTSSCIQTLDETGAALGRQGFVGFDDLLLLQGSIPAGTVRWQEAPAAAEEEEEEDVLTGCVKHKALPPRCYDQAVGRTSKLAKASARQQSFRSPTPPLALSRSNSGLCLVWPEGEGEASMCWWEADDGEAGADLLDFLDGQLGGAGFGMSLWQEHEDELEHGEAAGIATAA